MSEPQSATQWLEWRLRQEGLIEGGLSFRLLRGGLRLLAPLVDWMVQSKWSPDQLSMISVLFAFLAAWALIQAQNVWAFLFLALSGFCDLLDGWLARARSLNSPAGELLDTFCDRVSEILILSAFIWLALNSRAGESMRLWGVFASVISMVGALMMSFASALIPRKARVHRGILRRPERAILTAFAALFLQIFPGVSLSLLWVMGMGALSSAFFRILAYRRLLLRGEEKNDKPLERSRVVEEPQRPAEW